MKAKNGLEEPVSFLVCLNVAAQSGLPEPGGAAGEERRGEVIYKPGEIKQRLSWDLSEDLALL